MLRREFMSEAVLVVNSVEEMEKDIGRRAFEMILDVRDKYILYGDGNGGYQDFYQSPAEIRVKNTNRLFAKMINSKPKG